MSKNLLGAGLALLVLVLGGCTAENNGAAEGSGENRKPRVVATTGMIADATLRVAGDLVDVEALMGPGVDPHLYKASEGDVRRLGDADLILYNGLHLEGKMAELFERLARRRPVIAVAEVIPEDRLLLPDAANAAIDPHIWFDVSLWVEVLDPIVEALSELLPGSRATFEQRAADVRVQWLELDADVARAVATIPRERRLLVTAHDAFGYFGRRYDIEVVGIQGLSTLSEAGLADIDRVVDLVTERGVKAVFIESSVPRRAIEAVQAACRERGHDVAIGGELFSDAMGAADTPEGTYPGMVRHNVDTLVGALK